MDANIGDQSLVNAVLKQHCLASPVAAATLYPRVAALDCIGSNAFALLRQLLCLTSQPTVILPKCLLGSSCRLARILLKGDAKAAEQGKRITLILCGRLSASVPGPRRSRVK